MGAGLTIMIIKLNDLTLPHGIVASLTSGYPSKKARRILKFIRNEHCLIT